MNNLKNEVIKEHKQNLKNNIDKIQTNKGLNHLMGFYGKTYKKNPKENFIKFLKLKNEKELNQDLNKINEVANSKDFSGEFIITIEWKPSRMWRSNPKSYTNYGFEGSSIGGCGYDKGSTATAQALNSYLPILKLLYEKKNKDLPYFRKKSPDGKRLDKRNGYNRAVLGYGSGYGILPYFEGGVGVDSHRRIFENLGLVMQTITNTNNTDVYLIKRAKNG